MIDFAHVQKFIYFPKKHEHRVEPFVVYVLDRWGDDWRGNPDLNDLLKRSFSFYPVVRCQPYSEELWVRCQAWSARRAELEAEFERLRTKGVQA